MAKNGQPKEQASISFPITVLACLDEYCFKTDLDRSYVVSRAVKRFLAAEEGESDPSFWDTRYDKTEEKS